MVRYHVDWARDSRVYLLVPCNRSSPPVGFDTLVWFSAGSGPASFGFWAEKAAHFETGRASDSLHRWRNRDHAGNRHPLVSFRSHEVLRQSSVLVQDGVPIGSDHLPIHCAQASGFYRRSVLSSQSERNRFDDVVARRRVGRASDRVRLAYSSDTSAIVTIREAARESFSSNVSSGQ